MSLSLMPSFVVSATSKPGTSCVCRQSEGRVIIQIKSRSNGMPVEPPLQKISEFRLSHGGPSSIGLETYGCCLSIQLPSPTPLIAGGVGNNADGCASVPTKRTTPGSGCSQPGEAYFSGLDFDGIAKSLLSNPNTTSGSRTWRATFSRKLMASRKTVLPVGAFWHRCARISLFRMRTRKGKVSALQRRMRPLSRSLATPRLPKVRSSSGSKRGQRASHTKAPHDIGLERSPAFNIRCKRAPEGGRGAPVKSDEQASNSAPMSPGTGSSGRAAQAARYPAGGSVGRAPVSVKFHA
mmetsp:Transcript_14335/g.45938  ORF Transcript_14335/g.45938 Transcript_14335/m.45938 type:complete len:294 (+) Transcript_14335:1378-2259(+)